MELGRPNRRSNLGPKLLYGGLAVLIVVAGFLFIPRFEWHAPQVKLIPDHDTIGLKPIDIEVTEQGTGLKSVTVKLSAGGMDYPLAAEAYDQPVHSKKLTIALSGKLTGLKEGPAVLKIVAIDRSLWRFFRGNETIIEKNVTIDVSPPTIEIIADDAYVNFGGVGLVIFKPSIDAVTVGVKIGDYFFPAYKGQTKDPELYSVFFAHPYNVAEDEKATLIATDKAGNTKEVRLAYTLKGVNYRKSTLEISDEFIQAKVAPLLNDVGARQAKPQEIFVKVNRDLRKVNEAKIKSITEQRTEQKLWQGAFKQLRNSKVEANFADARTYKYNDNEIDKAYHLGYDLSVTKRYPVTASNSGIVAFVGDLGIYGNTVIIDHGLGLFTLYSHLSSIDVKEKEKIDLSQVIGKTGETGLAGGDHLHFGVYLNGVAVLPKEWWDEKWIRDNVTPKLENPTGAPAETAEAEKPVMKKRAKRRR